MANIFTLEKMDEFSEKINLDELYEKKKMHDMEKLELFNKILNRIHVRIKTVSRQKIDNQFCWYLMPETMIGVAKYDQAGCIAYVIEKLKKNGFIVRYIHPNLLFISWAHIIPSYIRTEIKKKTGISIDQFGNKIEEDDENNDVDIEPSDLNSFMNTERNQQNNGSDKNKKEYKSTQSYKPSGNLLYDDDLLNKINNRFNK
jgi:hypothetical protein